MPLTCEVLEGQNCWKDALAEIEGCAPGAGEIGLLAEDRANCSYVDGTQVVFRTVPAVEGPMWDFEVGLPGSPCVEVVHDQPDGGDRWEITTGGTSTVTYEIGDVARLTCSDGVIYETTPLAVFECDFDHMPGDVSISSETTLNYGLHGSGDALVEIFTCEAEGP